MTMNNQIRLAIISGMENLLDPYMLDQQFRRTRTSTVYKKQADGVMQSIDVAIEIHPRDNPNAAAAIYPKMEVHILQVDNMLNDIVKDDLGLLEGITAGVSKQPIGFTSRKADPGRWYLYQPDSIPEVLEAVKEFIDQWTLPLLNSYLTAEDIIMMDEKNDGRLVRDRAQIMRVVAAALTCGKQDYARSLMEKHLGAAGVRRRYQRVYDYIK